MTETQKLLDELAARYAIAPDYVDIFGQRHVTSNETKRAMLAAMHVDVDTDDDVRRELRRWDERLWHRPCDPVLVGTEGELPPTWSYRLPIEQGEDEMEVAWEARDEHGALCAAGEAGPRLPVTGVRVINDQRYVEVALPLPTGLPLGYYDLTARPQRGPGGAAGLLRLIVAPARCHVPSALEHGRRTWGLAVQLYGLRSAKNWGAGDLGDLGALTEWAGGELGAGIIGLNPLHALRNTRPYHISPYSPDSRLFVNPLYVNVDAVPELAESAKARAVVRARAFQARLRRARAAEMVEYELVHDAKMDALRACFAAFETKHLDDGLPVRAATERGRAFVDFVAREGVALERFALFHAVAAHLRKRDPELSSWMQWPEGYRHPALPDVAAFRARHARDVLFHQYVQWIASEQMGGVARRARELQMPVGLYHDLALGCERGGADAWAFQDTLALGADCGAPPDAFAPEGQNWGLPPMNPHRLREDGYRMYIDMLRHTLRHGGALRIDHVMALFRLFWIPRGMPAAAGTYVHYPSDDLLGILALESVRHGTVIVGEDLGTVPDYVREKLAARRVLSYRVSYFERWDNQEWKAPSDYPAQALAVVTTHDLPTLAGFWVGMDLQTRTRLALYRDDGARQEAWAERRRDKARMVRALQSQGLLPPGDADPWVDRPELPREVWEGVHLYLARTPAAMMLANLEDLVGERNQANLPGTVDSHPNWSRKLPLTLAQLKSDPRPRELASALRPLRS